MIKYDTTIKYNEDVYLPDKTLKEISNVKINELVENINDVKIRLTNNTVYNNLAIDNYNRTTELQQDLIELDCNNTFEHKKLKKLAKLAILSKFI